MFKWSINPQDICWWKCLRTVFTAGFFLAKASSSDLQMRLDIVVLAEDSEVTDLARSPTSSTHSRGELLELTLLVPTWTTICCGFLPKSGLIRYVMSSVVHPGNVAILNRKFLDILWLWRYFSVESPVMIIFFRQLGCGWSWSFGIDSVETDCMDLRVPRCEKDDEGVFWSLSPLFAFWLATFLTSNSSLFRFAATRNCYEFQWNWRALTSYYVLLVHIYLATYPLKPNILLTLNDYYQLHSFLQ